MAGTSLFSRRPGWMQGATAMTTRWLDSTLEMARWENVRKAGRRWGWWGAGLGALLGFIAYAPAAWLAQGVVDMTNRRLLLADSQGTIWHGNAVAVLTGGRGSRDARALPGRLHWSMGFKGMGLKLTLSQDCCMPTPVVIVLKPGIERVLVDVRLQASGDAELRQRRDRGRGPRDGGWHPAQQFVVDPRVRGNDHAVQRAAADAARGLSQLPGGAARPQGFAVVEVGGLLKIVPEADAKLQTGTVSVGCRRSRRPDVTQIFRLSYENANNLVPVLRPLISPNNTINANPGNNSLVITDYADNLQRMGKIIAALDVQSRWRRRGDPAALHAASDIAPMVQRLADTGGSGGAPGGPRRAATIAPP
jgi:hypothetical protein